MGVTRGPALTARKKPYYLLPPAAEEISLRFGMRGPTWSERRKPYYLLPPAAEEIPLRLGMRGPTWSERLEPQRMPVFAYGGKGSLRFGVPGPTWFTIPPSRLGRDASLYTRESFGGRGHGLSLRPFGHLPLHEGGSGGDRSASKGCRFSPRGLQGPSCSELAEHVQGSLHGGGSIPLRPRLLHVAKLGLITLYSKITASCDRIFASGVTIITMDTATRAQKDTISL